MGSTGSNRQALGAAVILLAVGATIAVVAFSRRGGEVEKGFAIVGQGVPPSAPGDVAAPATGPSSTALTPPAPSPPVGPAPVEVVVHVAGAVKRPGVVHLKLGARAEDALKAAGGATEKANTDALNLAEKLEDGRQLYVPTRTEAPPGTSAAGSTAGAAAPAAAAGARPSGGAPGKLRTPGEGTVNINTAGEEELQRLPGVGPSYAARILQYRKENGRFASPDDLMNVSGIGPKKLEAMRPFVRVR